MASKTALLILLNIVFFTMVSSTSVPCGCSTPKTPSTRKTPKTPTPSTPKTPKTPTPSTPKIPKAPTTPTPSQANCPIDTLRLGVCGNLLSGLVNVVVGTPPRTQTPCCSLINGLADLDAAVCLCTSIRDNVLGINLNVPVSLSLLLNYCGKNAPSGFQCA